MMQTTFRALAFVLAAAAAAPAPADEFLNRANDTYRTIRQDRRSDLVLLPAVAGMTPPPAAVAERERAMLLPAGAAGWDAAEAWAMEEPQRAVLEALDRVTSIDNPFEAYGFGQPYGYDGVPIELIQAGLYTEVGDPPTLAAAQFGCLPALDRVACLVNVEATRLAAAGDEAAAIDVLIDWLYFSRQMADRAMFEEVRWGIRSMVAALERIRDVAYTDFRYGDRSVDVEDLLQALRRLREEGYLGLERLRFPEGDRIAAEQLVARAFLPRGGPNPDTFGPTLARLGSTERPLRLFSEASRWDVVAPGHADQFAMTDEIKRVYGDWLGRWPLGPFDPRMAEVFDYAKIDRARFAALAAVLPDMSILFNDRQVARAQAVGTRTALGIVAYFYGNGAFPPTVSAIRPRFLPRVEPDPFNPDRGRGLEPPLQYFVPNRINYRRLDPREVPQPHTINVFTPGGEYNFRILVGDDQFVLYSLGPDKAPGWAELASGEPAADSPGDLLIWPPAISLLRQHLQESGQLK